MDEKGHVGFSKHYWDINYAVPEDMDGVGNAKFHVQYLKFLFKLEYIDISSILDYGAGQGVLFSKMIEEFLPYKSMAIEPSPYAFKLLKKKKLAFVSSMKVKLVKSDIQKFCVSNPNLKTFDLGICSSVFQYLTEKEIDFCLPSMAKQVKYLYFSVPTDKELRRQVKELEFEDVYAIKRSRLWYQKKIKKYFTFISARVLESKFHFNEETTSFTDLLFRF